MELIEAVEAIPFLERARVDEEREFLVGSMCRSCGARSWPARAVCSNCGSAHLTPQGLPAVGTLTSYTTVHVPREGLSTPYVLGQIDFGGGATVFAHVRALPDDSIVPLPVRTVLADDASAVPRFWFEPVDGTPTHPD